MDVWESLQQVAMQAAVAPDDDAWLRRIFRQYSKSFSTPLHLVSELPIEDVLLAVFEDMFENMDEEDRDERIAWLLKTPEERLADKGPATALGDKDDKFYDTLNSEVASGEVIKRPKEPKREVVATEEQPLPAGMQQLANKMKKVKAKADKMGGTSLPSPKAAVKAVTRQEAPATLGEFPEIDLSFGSGGNLSSKWDDLDPLSLPKKKR